MKYLIRIAAVLLLLIVAAASYIYHGLSNRPDIDAFNAFKTFSKANRDPGLRVTFLGVSTLLLDDGETAILTDGFFTRPNSRQLFLEKIAPDTALIAKTLQRRGHYQTCRRDRQSLALRPRDGFTGGRGTNRRNSRRIGIDRECRARLGLTGWPDRRASCWRLNDLRTFSHHAASWPPCAVALHWRRDHRAVEATGPRQRLSRGRGVS